MPITTYVNNMLIITLAPSVDLLGMIGTALLVACILSVAAPQGWAWRELPAPKKVFGAGITLLGLSIGIFSVVQWMVF